MNSLTTQNHGDLENALELLVNLPEERLLQLVHTRGNIQRAIQEERAKTLKDTIDRCILLTNQEDWIDERGRPYLMVSGAIKVIGMFDMTVTNSVRTFETIDYGDGNPEKIVIIDANASINGLGSFPVIGTASSRDDMYIDKESPSGYKPLNTIRIGNIIKKAKTNLLGNAIRDFLKNSTWDYITKVTNGAITQNGSKKVGKIISEDSALLYSKISSMVMELHPKDAKKQTELFLKWTSFTKKDGSTYTGQADPKRWTDKQIPAIYGKCKAYYLEVTGHNFEDQKIETQQENE